MTETNKPITAKKRTNKKQEKYEHLLKDLTWYEDWFKNKGNLFENKIYEDDSFENGYTMAMKTAERMISTLLDRYN